MTTTENLKGVAGIYCAIHRESLACYVGSSTNIGSRRTGHLCDASSGRSKTAFHRALLKFGPESFDIEVVERCNPSDLKAREDFWIVFMEGAGPRGFNTCRSSVWHGLADATLERMRVANLGRKHTEQTKKKISESKTGIKVSETTRLRMSKAQSGRLVSEEAKNKQRAKMAGRRHSLETRRKIKAGALRRWSRYRSNIFNLVGESLGEKTPLASAAA